MIDSYLKECDRYLSFFSCNFFNADSPLFDPSTSLGDIQKVRSLKITEFWNLYKVDNMAKVSALWRCPFYRDSI